MGDDVNDLRDTIVPKSDQLNADDLLAGPMDVTITAVRRGDREGPVAIHIDGQRPFKPCKSVRRVLIAAWGSDGRQWVGRSMRLYRDPEVMYGGVKVGGIRVSHLSHIDAKLVLMLTTTRGKRSECVIEPMPSPQQKRAPNPDVEWLKSQDQDVVKQVRAELFGDRKLKPEDVATLRAAVEKQVPPTEREPGDEEDL